MKPENPPAFPIIDPNYIQEGMSLRDYLAGQIAGQVIHDWAGSDPRYAEETATRIYTFADAMLVEGCK